MSRLRRVGEIFNNEKEARVAPQSTDTTEDLPGNTDTVITIHPMPEDQTQAIPEPDNPPPLPDLPPVPSNDVLRVTNSEQLPKEVTNQYGKKKVQWTTHKLINPRKILEICTWTMLITTLALERDPKWKACTPVSIEHGYDLLTTAGRRRAEAYIKSEKPDLIVGEWMCGPFSSIQNINLSKGPELRNKILAEQREHAKVSA